MSIDKKIYSKGFITTIILKLNVTTGKILFIKRCPWKQDKHYLKKNWNFLQGRKGYLHFSLDVFFFTIYISFFKEQSFKVQFG